MFKDLFLLVVLMTVLSGCTINDKAQQSSVPTVSGCISTGAVKKF
jgi:hypothetical protein